MHSEFGQFEVFSTTRPSTTRARWPCRCWGSGPTNRLGTGIADDCVSLRII